MCCLLSAKHAKSKTLHQQNPPVLNWKRWLMQADLYNGRKTVVLLLKLRLASGTTTLLSIHVQSLILLLAFNCIRTSVICFYNVWTNIRHVLFEKTIATRDNSSEYTHPFNGHLSGTTQVRRYQKGKTNLDFTEARHSERQCISWAICKSALRFAKKISNCHKINKTVFSKKQAISNANCLFPESCHLISNLMQGKHNNSPQGCVPSRLSCTASACAK